MPTFFTIVIVVIILHIVKSMFSWEGEAMNVQQLRDAWANPATRQADARLIDVREPGEFSGGHVPGAINIPLASIGNRATELASASTLYVICHSGARSAAACGTLQKQLPATVKIINISGGTAAWQAAGFPVEK
ncbi:MAG TPA: rhodanese-like domain-containing protein [Candidatus Ozemobacteraceae bacterium]|nr:rhodanese-like domain-containing protein [Candidatus Ozemobacteraceae bacterium]